MREKENNIAALFTFLVSFAVYIKTLAPTLSLWDCGEFITSSATLGVPHPPGAPFYLLVGRVFSMIPFAEDIGFRVNMVSALSSALTVMLLYLIIVRLIKEYYGHPVEFEQKLVVYGGGVIGALTFAFTETFWFNAVEAEVYAFSMLLTALPIYLALKWMDFHKELSSLKLLLVCSYLFGLAIGVHLLNLLIIPSIMLLIFFYKRDLFLNTKFWIAAGVILIIGFSTYLMIYIRANHGPFLNENDPSTFDRFMSYWRRDQYGRKSLFLTFFDRVAPFWEYQIKKMYLRYFAWNFMGKGTTIGADRYIVETFSPNGLFYMPFILGIIGVYHHIRKDFKRFLAIMLLFIMTGIAIIVYLNQPDPQPRERDYVYVGSFFAFAIWIGIGFGAILEKALAWVKNAPGVKNIVLGGVVGIGIVMGPFIQFNHNYDSSDRTGLYFAWDYSYNILNSCEENAILVTNGDNDTFPLWYLQAIEGVRTDVTIVNLSLLNTNWYNMQLKYGNPIYPPLKITLDDQQIENLSPIPWNSQNINIPVPKEVYNSLAAETHPSFNLQPIEQDTVMTFKVDPTFTDRGLRAQDFMIINIIYANQWERPFYIAMTVPNSNKVGLVNNLRMDGMAFRLVPFNGRNLAPQNIKNNLINRYQYRGFNDPEVYYNIQKRDLFQNLRTCFLVAADFYWRQGEHENMLAVLEEQDRRMPEEVLPLPSYQLAGRIAQMFYDGGKKEVAHEKINRILLRPDVDDDTSIDIARLMVQQLDMADRALEICNEVLERQPFHNKASSLKISIFELQKDYGAAVEFLDNWLVQNPADSGAIVARDRYKMMLSVTDTTSR